MISPIGLLRVMMRPECDSASPSAVAVQATDVLGGIGAAVGDHEQAAFLSAGAGYGRSVGTGPAVECIHHQWTPGRHLGALQNYAATLTKTADWAGSKGLTQLTQYTSSPG